MNELRTIAIVEKKSLVKELMKEFDTLVVSEHDDKTGYIAHIKAPADFNEIFLVTSIIRMEAESDSWAKGWSNGFDSAIKHF